MKQQSLSRPNRFSSPLAEHTPPHSPFIGNVHSKVEDANLTMASPAQHQEELEVSPTKDRPPQDHNRIEPLMNLNDQPSVSPIPEIK